MQLSVCTSDTFLHPPSLVWYGMVRLSNLETLRIA